MSEYKRSDSYGLLASQETILKHKEACKKYVEKSKKMSYEEKDYDFFYDYEDKEASILDKILIDKREFKAFVLGILIIAGAIGLFKFGKDINYSFKQKEVTDEAILDAYNELRKHNIFTFQNVNNEFNNDYSNLYAKQDDVYGYLNILGYEETEKVLKSMGYTDWNSFLFIEGYFDDDGKPSLEVFKQREIERLVDENKRR